MKSSITVFPMTLSLRACRITMLCLEAMTLSLIHIYYFDISDTHESRYSRTVPIWDMRQEYEADVIET